MISSIPTSTDSSCTTRSLMFFGLGRGGDLREPTSRRYRRIPALAEVRVWTTEHEGHTYISSTESLVFEIVEDIPDAHMLVWARRKGGVMLGAKGLGYDLRIGDSCRLAP